MYNDISSYKLKEVKRVIKWLIELVKKKIVNPVKEELGRYEFAMYSHDRSEKLKVDYQKWEKEYWQSICKVYKSE